MRISKTSLNRTSSRDRTFAATIPRLVLACLAFVLTAVFPPSGWTDETLTQIYPKLSLSGDLRARGEMWNRFASSDTQDNDYDYLATVTKVGFKWNDEDFDVMLETQKSVLIDFPGNALSYNWNKYINVSLYDAHIFGGSVVRSIFSGDQADFGYLEVTLRF